MESNIPSLSIGTDKSNSSIENPLSFRYTIPENKTPEECYIFFLKCIKEFLGYHNVDIRKLSVGYHDDTDRPHIHIHIILSNRLMLGKKSCYDSFRDWCKKENDKFGYYKNLTTVKRGASMISNPTYTDFSGNSHIFAPDTFTRFLSYPFKCNKFIDYFEGDTHFFEDNPLIQKMMLNANAEHVASVEFRKKREIIKRKKQYKKSKLEVFVLELEPLSLTDCYNYTLSFYKKQSEELGEQPPNFTTMIYNAEQVAFKHGIISFDDVIKIVRPRHVDTIQQALTLIKENDLKE